MKCKVLLRVNSENTSFQYLTGIVSLISVNKTNRNIEIGYLVNNVERLHKNECG